MFKVVLLNEVRARSHPLLDRLNNLRTGQSFFTCFTHLGGGLIVIYLSLLWELKLNFFSIAIGFPLQLSKLFNLTLLWFSA